MRAFSQGNIFETVKTGLAGRLAEVLADLLPGGVSQFLDADFVQRLHG